MAADILLKTTKLNKYCEWFHLFSDDVLHFITWLHISLCSQQDNNELRVMSCHVKTFSEKILTRQAAAILHPDGGERNQPPF